MTPSIAIVNAAPTILAVLILSAALLALRAVALSFEMPLTRRANHALDGSIAVLVGLFGILVVFRFVSLV